MQLGLGASYGHKFINILMDEFFWWCGMVQYYGVGGWRGGGGGSLGICIIGG